MSAFIHLVADYGVADPAFSEVVHRLKALDPSIDVQTTDVPPLSTIATGFWIEQLAVHNPAFDDLLIYSNTAPRTEQQTVSSAPAGGTLCYAEAENGTPVIAVDAGYNLAFIKPHLKEFREVEVPAESSQFRSRDFFPQSVVAIANGNTEILGQNRSLDEIPSQPEAVVCHVDGYGNIKTSIRASTLRQTSGTQTLRIDGVTNEISVRETVSDVADGTLGVVPGSSGGSDPYVEVFLRGGSAAQVFEQPNPGEPVELISSHH